MVLAISDLRIRYGRGGLQPTVTDANLVLGYLGGSYLDERFGTAPWGMVGGLGVVDFAPATSRVTYWT